MTQETLSADQVAIARFLCKLSDFSYSRAEAAHQLDPDVPIEQGWQTHDVRSVHDPASGMDFTVFTRVSASGVTDVAVCFRGAQVTWRPQALDVVAGLRRGLPQWQRSRDLVLRKLAAPLRAAHLSAGRVFVTGQSMGHMLMQFAAVDIVDHLAQQPENAGDAAQAGRQVVAYGFGGVGVADALLAIQLADGRQLNSALLDHADIKHFRDDWDPAGVFSWPYAGDGGRTWRAAKPYPPLRTAIGKSLWMTVGGVRLPNLMAPVSFLWHFFYTAHSVTGYGLSDYAKATPRP